MPQPEAGGLPAVSVTPCLHSLPERGLCVLLGPPIVTKPLTGEQGLPAAKGLSSLAQEDEAGPLALGGAEGTPGCREVSLLPRPLPLPCPLSPVSFRPGPGAWPVS